MKRYELLNWFIAKYQYQSYLEIGVDKPENCFNRINAARKVGVDPNVGATTLTGAAIHYRLTSDVFFTKNKAQFDLVFIDGLHDAEQVLRDVDNAFKALSEGGTVILHDCDPTRYDIAQKIRTAPGLWFGNVWEAWSYLRASRPGFYMRTLRCDCGLGIIRRGHQEVYAGDWSSWDAWAANKDIIQLPVSVEELEGVYGRY